MVSNIYFRNSYHDYFNLILKEIIHGGYLTALGAPALVLTTSIITKSDINIPITDYILFNPINNLQL